MKSLFSVNITTDEVCGMEFIIRKPDSDLARKSDEATATLSAYQKKSSMPLWYTIIEYLILLAAGICASSFADACSDNGFEITYQRGEWALYIGGAGFLVWLVLFIIEKVRFKKVAQNPEVNDFLNGMDELNNDIKDNLRVPKSCVNIDVLAYPFKLRNGKERRVNGLFNYFNFSMWAFKEGEYLCLADTSGVYGIPLSSITETVFIKKTVSVPQWNKDEPIKDEKYKKAVKANNYGTYLIKNHYSVRFTRHGEEWEILIPAYDIDAITGLTGIYPAP